MGGNGSGEHFRSRYYRLTVEDCIVFYFGQSEIRRIIDDPDYYKYFEVIEFYKDKKLFLTTKCLLRVENSEKILILGNKQGFNEFKLTYQNTGEKKYGSKRVMISCPDCGNKVLKVFLRPPYYNNWKCRLCHYLTHESTKESRRPGKFDYLIAAQINISARVVRRILNRLRPSRYSGDYFISNLYTEETFMKQIGLKLSEYEIKEVQKLSKELDLSKSEIIRRAIDHYIDFLKMQKRKIEGQ